MACVCIDFEQNPESKSERKAMSERTAKNDPFRKIRVLSLRTHTCNYSLEGAMELKFVPFCSS